MKLRKIKNSEYVIYIAFALLISFLTYIYVFSEMKNYYTDYSAHSRAYLSLFFSRDTLAEGFMAVPYCLWHLVALFMYKVVGAPIEASAAYSAILFSLLSYLIILFILNRVSENSGDLTSPGVFPALKNAFISAGLCIAQPLYFYWIGSGDRYSGVFSPNPLHNPTNMCVRPFSLLAFILIYDIWGAQENSSYKGLFFKVEKGLKRYYVLLSVTLFISTLAKPTFDQVFIPAVGLVMLVKLIARHVRKSDDRKAYTKNFLYTFLCAVPSLIFIAVMFFVYYTLDGNYYDTGSKVVITQLGEVWSLYSDNIALSVFLGMAFPLYMVLIDTRYFIKNDFGRLALITYVIGFTEAMLIGETGRKMMDADYIWPMMSGMLLMHLASLTRLVHLEKNIGENRKLQIAVIIGWILFLAHVFCGILFLKAKIGMWG